LIVDNVGGDTLEEDLALKVGLLGFLLLLLEKFGVVLESEFLELVLFYDREVVALLLFGMQVLPELLFSLKVRLLVVFVH